MFWKDDRAQSVQMGVVMLLGVVVVTMSIFQVTVVPAENELVEYKHNTQAQEQLVDLRNGLLRTGSTGDAQPTSITLGTGYPSRTFYVNPPPATGTVVSTDLGNVTVSNATIRGDTGDYWTGATRRFATNGLRYEPNYAEYGNAPITRYEHSVLYNEFPNDASLPVTGQQLVDGRRINLMVLDGNVSSTRRDSVAVDPRPVSATTGAISVRNSTDGPIRISFRTRMPESKWRELLASELDPDGSEPDAYVSALNYDASTTPNTVTLTFENETSYDLRMAKVGVGTDVADEGPHYVVGTDTNSVTVASTQTTNLGVAVHDRFNNRQSGVPITFEASAGTFGNDESTITVTSDASSQTEVTYVPPQSGSLVEVTAKADVDGDGDYDLAREKVTYDVHVISLPSSASSILAAGNEHLYIHNASGDGPGVDDPYGVVMDVTNVGNDTVTITGIAVNRTSTEADRFWEGQGENPDDHSAWTNEVFMDVTDSPNVLNNSTEGDGHFESGGDGTSDKIMMGEKVDLASDLSDSGVRNNVSILEPGTEGRWYLYLFRDGTGSAKEVEMKGEVIRMTIYYTTEGESHEYLFDVFLL